MLAGTPIHSEVSGMIEPTGAGSEIILGEASRGLKVINRKNRKVNPIPAQAR
jgi:hypothetical protein